jgi:hypothetical protein
MMQTLARNEIDSTVGSPQIGHPQIGRILEVTGFAATDALPRRLDIGQSLKATGLLGSGGYPIRGLSTVPTNYFKNLILG